MQGGRQPGTIRGHPWPSAAIRGHPRSSAADLDTYWPNDPLTFAIREQSGCTQCALSVHSVCTQGARTGQTVP